MKVCANFFFFASNNTTFVTQSFRTLGKCLSAAAHWLWNDCV